MYRSEVRKRIIMWSYTHNAYIKMVRVSEREKELVKQRGCLLRSCCIALLLSLCFIQLIEWVNCDSTGNMLNEEKWNRPLRLAKIHMQVHMTTFKAIAAQMQNKNDYENDCRQFTLASFLLWHFMCTFLQQPDFVCVPVPSMDLAIR